MKFGKLENIEGINFNLVLPYAKEQEASDQLNIFVGDTGWSNYKVLKSEKARGLEHSLQVYAEHFNCIEMNASYYRLPNNEKIQEYKAMVPAGFKFCPKIHKVISQNNRLSLGEDISVQMKDCMDAFDDMLGLSFLQLSEYKKLDFLETLQQFIKNFESRKLAVEFRHPSWFSNRVLRSEAFTVLNKNGNTAVITDTTGVREIVHHSITADSIFIRFACTNDPVTDQKRLTSWLDFKKAWMAAGVKEAYFMLHSDRKETKLELAKFIQEHSN